MQRRSGQRGPTLGSDWVDELASLAEQSSAVPGGPNFSGSVSVLSPSEALGCTSDLIVMANLSSSSWDLRVPKTPFLGEEERHSLGILRPDAPIRDARHSLQHILHSSPEVIILDPSMDETAPPSAPIREWASDSDVEGIEEGITSSPLHSSPRGTPGRTTACESGSHEAHPSPQSTLARSRFQSTHTSRGTAKEGSPQSPRRMGICRKIPESTYSPSRD